MSAFRPMACAIVIATGASFAIPAHAQQPSRELSAEEQTACRSDAIRLCFFKIANADALKACLRTNKPDLSPSCKKLIESRGN
jgi:hypothetical protein